MYPGTIVNWHDQSAITTTTATTVDNTPLFLHVSSFDRGPEELKVVTASNFYDLYGSKMNFAKHGQPAIQAAKIIAAGGKLLLKRLVADDALLANVVFVANVTTVITCTPTTDANKDQGVSLTYIKTGKEDATDTSSYIPTSVTKVKWTALTVSDCKTYADVETAAAKAYVVTDPTSTIDDATKVATVTKVTSFPLIIAADNGRGVSNKAIRFSADLATSKDMDNMYYNVYVYDGTTKLESCVATLNPSTIFNNKLYGLSVDTSSQIRFGTIKGVYEKYIAYMVNVTGLTEAALIKDDMIFALDNRGAAIPNLSLDTESVDLGATYGVELQNGSNGSFGDAPFGTDAWATKAVELFNGTYDPMIWDVDTYKIVAVFDANYPDTVKTAIAEFVTFREDCAFYRDYGTSISSYASIVAKYKSIDSEHKNKFINDFFTTYQIYDPETKVRERVTMMYNFAAVMVGLCAAGAYRPSAGIVNGMILADAIEGTINFTPIITPTANQKSLLDDMRINYAIFQNGQCVVQSVYTSQEAYTQLSYSNNVLGIQEVIRAVRTYCPKQRYTFTSGADFSSYADAVNNILKNFKSNFAELSFSYTQDTLKAANKIFYATISFRFNNWAQTEQFDIYALGDDTES